MVRTQARDGPLVRLSRWQVPVFLSHLFHLMPGLAVVPNGGFLPYLSYLPRLVAALIAFIFYIFVEHNLYLLLSCSTPCSFPQERISSSCLSGNPKFIILLIFFQLLLMLLVMEKSFQVLGFHQHIGLFPGLFHMVRILFLAQAGLVSYN